MPLLRHVSYRPHHPDTDNEMKTLYEEVIDLLRDLRASWRRPACHIVHDRPDTGSAVRTAPGCAPEDVHIDTLAREFPRELFARLLLELPLQRSMLVEAHASGDQRRLRDCVHQILGAAAYCEAEELDQGLRELRHALRAGDRRSIDDCYHRALRAIDSTLRNSGTAVEALKTTSAVPRPLSSAPATSATSSPPPRRTGR